MQSEQHVFVTGMLIKAAAAIATAAAEAPIWYRIVSQNVYLGMVGATSRLAIYSLSCPSQWPNISDFGVQKRDRSIW